MRTDDDQTSTPPHSDGLRAPIVELHPPGRRAMLISEGVRALCQLPLPCLEAAVADLLDAERRGLGGREAVDELADPVQHPSARGGVDLAQDPQQLRRLRIVVSRDGGA